ncbi:hypothetical protein [Intrasporangium calvum]|uniref:hypothetical protein n=1 Tax=Intrasporangium calvum TaxID=53358 RepID=UPI000DF5D620|nr:hypothetical protein [Intrasporangium calvum]AXG14966.1 hypothetical protein DN585_17520 [Intrasporangium calvum]
MRTFLHPPTLRRSSRQFCRAVLLAILIALGATVLTAGTASASQLAMPTAPWDCKTAPTAAVPDTGLPGFFDAPPDPIPPKADPFGPDRKSTIYDQYGYAGLGWNTYDLGCMGGLGDMDATVDTFLGNVFLSAGTWITSATNGVHNRVAHPEQYMGPLDSVVATVSTRLKTAIWSPWGIVALLGVAGLLLYYSMHGRLSSVVSGAAWALLVLAVLAGVSEYPTRIAGFFDQTVTQTIASVNESSAGLTATAGADATRAQGSLIVDDVLYQAWLRGQFGDPDSAAARTWGPLLFRESTFGRAELQAAQASPEGVRKMTEQKANDWVATTQEIQEEDPLAYAAVQGKAKGRAGAGFMAFMGVLLTGVFRLIADIFVFAGLVMLRLLVMFFPAAAVFGVIAPMSTIVRRIGNIAGASIVNVIAFGAGSAVHTLVISSILSRADGAGMGVLGLVLCLVVTLAAFILLLPLLSFTNMLGHTPRGQSMLRTARRTALGYLVGRKAVGDGNQDADNREQPTSTPPTTQGGGTPVDDRPIQDVRRINLPPEAVGRRFPAGAEFPEVPDAERKLSGRSGQPAPQLVAAPSGAGGASESAADTGRDRARESRPSGIRHRGRHDPGTSRPGERRLLTGTIVDEVPAGIPELSVTRPHDSNAEVTSDGVRNRVYDPTTKSFITSDEGRATAGGRDE